MQRKGLEPDTEHANLHSSLLPNRLTRYLLTNYTTSVNERNESRISCCVRRLVWLAFIIKSPFDGTTTVELYNARKQ